MDGDNKDGNVWNAAAVILDIDSGVLTDSHINTLIFSIRWGQDSRQHAFPCAEIFVRLWSNMQRTCNHEEIASNLRPVFFYKAASNN